MKVVTFSLGCKVNKYESDSICEDFKKQGYEVSDKLEWADIYIINTCAVTSEAEKKSRQMIARCKKFNPDAKIYVCGCASQKNPGQFDEKGVFLVKGVAGKQKLIEELQTKGKKMDTLPTGYEKMTFSNQSRTRAYLKIQDGCNNFCTYCIIPYLRGRSRSRDVDDIIKEVRNLPDEVKEIVLVGINVADFKINGEKALIDLLEKLDGFNKRIRLGSIEDGIIDESFVKRLSKLKNFCPHFHLSLQGGSDEVLKRMNRHYTASQFANSVEIIRKYFPLAGITTDVIVGFPGEGEKEFKETFDFIKKLKFSGLHIFPYSRREGTVAFKMQDTSVEVKKNRVKTLQELNTTLFDEFLKKNNNLSVLLEENEKGFLVGHSKNFIKVYIKSENFSIGDIVTVKIKEKFLDGVIGSPI